MRRPQKWKEYLTGRLARNLYFWALLLFVAFSLNSGNEPLYHYGIVYSSWYIPVMAAMLLLQTTLMYVNNLWLAPRFLARGRRAAYAGRALLLAGGVSALTVLLFKAAKPYLNVEELQHPGFTATSISPGWNWEVVLLSEFSTFLFSNLLWLFLFTLAWYATDYFRQRRILQQLEADRTKAELSFLKSQLSPHFLFNTLNNIYGLVLQQSKEAPKVLLRLSALLRYLLYESNEATISFSKEQSAIEAYLEIEALRLPAEAYVRGYFHTDKDYFLPPLLWMPLLENGFKHGTQVATLPVLVDFSFTIEKNQAVIRTRNHFEAAPPTAVPAGGMGLANLRKRLRLLYPDRYTLVRTEEGTLVTYLLTVTLI